MRKRALRFSSSSCSPPAPVGGNWLSKSPKAPTLVVMGVGAVALGTLGTTLGGRGAGGMAVGIES